MIAGLVLAGGMSRRMGGGAKHLLAIEGSPLIDRVVARLAPQVSAIAISAREPPSTPGVAGLPILPDQRPSRGPLSGVHAGLVWASRDLAFCTHLATAAADTPFFPADFVSRLSTASDGERIAVASSSGRAHPVFALWPVTLESRLRAFLASAANAKMMDFIDAVGWVRVDFETEGEADPFFNINTPDDLNKARELARS